jgi:hypothetical protein
MWFAIVAAKKITAYLLLHAPTINAVVLAALLLSFS